MNIESGFVITEDNQRITYHHYQNHFKKVIVIAHGFFNSKQSVLFKQMAEKLIDGYDVIIMDFRGHGKSKGWFTWTAKEYLDLEAVLKYAHQRYERIGVVGYSLGAAVSLVTAARGNFMDSLVSVSAPTEFGKIDFHLWKMGIMENIIYNIFQEGRIGKGVRPGGLWMKKVKPIDIVQNIKIPVLFVHGDQDWLIELWHSRKLFEKAKCKKRLEVIPGGTHAEYLFRRNREGTIKLFKDWFHDTL